ncbi:hypothetical protein BCEN4_860051 [Burkholderia cenocepacia]|nr:hypothetical protein BCEN4_860051 [Burkholderia cenocepacia]
MQRVRAAARRASACAGTTRRGPPARLAIDSSYPLISVLHRHTVRCRAMAARATARLPCRRAAVHTFTFVSIHIEANARDDAPLDAAAFSPLCCGKWIRRGQAESGRGDLHPARPPRQPSVAYPRAREFPVGRRAV